MLRKNVFMYEIWKSTHNWLQRVIGTHIEQLIIIFQNFLWYTQAAFCMKSARRFSIVYPPIFYIHTYIIFWYDVYKWSFECIFYTYIRSILYEWARLVWDFMRPTLIRDSSLWLSSMLLDLEMSLDRVQQDLKLCIRMKSSTLLLIWVQ